MKWRRVKTPFVVAISLLVCSLLGWPQVARPQRKTSSGPHGVIQGQVRNPDGSPAGEGVLITAESARGGMGGQVTTDSQGKFSISGLGKDIFILSARFPGYQQTSVRIDLSTVPREYVVLTLQPAPAEPAPSPATLGSLVGVEDLNVPESAQREVEKGRKLLFDDKKPSESIAFFRKAIKIAPSYSRAHFLLGTAYMDLGQWEEAESALSKAVELNDKLGLAFLELGSCLNQQKKFAEAEKPLRRALELNPDAAQGHYELGRTYWALGRWQEAEPRARKAAQLKPNLAPVHVLLGNIFLRKREAAAALQEFKEYLRLEPNGPFAAPTREVVAKIEQALATAR